MMRDNCYTWTHIFSLCECSRCPCSAQAGAVDEECFIASFEDVPTVNLFSAKDLEEQMKIIKDTVGDDKKDWKQRMDNVRARVSQVSL